MANSYNTLVLVASRTSSRCHDILPDFCIWWQANALQSCFVLVSAQCQNWSLTMTAWYRTRQSSLPTWWTLGSWWDPCLPQRNIGWRVSLFLHLLIALQIQSINTFCILLWSFLSCLATGAPHLNTRDTLWRLRSSDVCMCLYFCEGSYTICSLAWLI